ncbi:hypothetical protein [Peribacillus muralis]|uniref:hypothetical protein n=1 Tax=Peribacillus muralis TaxID=264697 RepID=UPI003CFD56D0
MVKNLVTTYPNRIKDYEQLISHIQSDLSLASSQPDGGFHIELGGVTFVEEKEAGQALQAIIHSTPSLDEKSVHIGRYKGLNVCIKQNVFNEYCVGLKGESTHDVHVMSSEKGNIQRLVKLIDDYPQKVRELEANIMQGKSQIKEVEGEINRPFIYENNLNDLLKKQTNLNLKKI